MSSSIGIKIPFIYLETFFIQNLTHGFEKNYAKICNILYIRLLSVEKIFIFNIFYDLAFAKGKERLEGKR